MEPVCIAAIPLAVLRRRLPQLVRCGKATAGLGRPASERRFVNGSVLGAEASSFAEKDVPALSDREIASARRLCFFAHYHPHGLAGDHVLLYLRALADAGFAVVVLSTADMSEGEQAKLQAACARLIMRENVGLDFGGWIEAVQRFFPIEAELLLLANDSVYAPVGDLPAFIDRLTAEPADFYGAVESMEYGRHLQSWFLLLRPAAYMSNAFRTLFATPVPSDLSKLDVIMTYEVGFAKRLAAEGLTYRAAYSQLSNGLLVGRKTINAGHLLWRELIEQAGLPFLKIELLRDNPARIGNLESWPMVVETRNAELQAAISADLQIRRSASGVGAKHRWLSTLGERNPFLWPELQGFVRRDFHVSGLRMGHQLNRLAYRLAIRVAKKVRAAAKPWGVPGPPQPSSGARIHEASVR